MGLLTLSHHFSWKRIFHYNWDLLISVQKCFALEVLLCCIVLYLSPSHNHSPCYGQSFALGLWGSFAISDAISLSATLKLLYNISQIHWSVASYEIISGLLSGLTSNVLQNFFCIHCISVFNSPVSLCQFAHSFPEEFMPSLDSMTRCQWIHWRHFVEPFTRPSSHPASQQTQTCSLSSKCGQH